MKRPLLLTTAAAGLFLAAPWVANVLAQVPPGPDGGPTTRPLPPEGGPGGRGFPGGPGGMMGGPMGGPDRKLVAQFDKDGDGRLNTEERKSAREAAKQGGRGGMRPGGGGAPGGPGGGGMRAGNREPAKPGPNVSPADVKNFPDADLYEPTVLRTLFLDFESGDWEAELADFKPTDVEVPATLTVDGKKYPNVGVSFRGMSSFGGVPAGYKRSLNLSLDHADDKQRLRGRKTLNLLNSHSDPTFLHTVLYSHVAGQYIPAPKANLVKVVINGQSWGVYVNVEQFNKEFAKAWFPDDVKAKATEQKPADKKADEPKVARWKVSGSPGGGGSLAYLGDDPAAYKRLYEIKSDDSPASWTALATLCKVLNETPADQLEAALKPILNVEGALWFLALDDVFVNGDGYWTRGSDYNLLRDKAGRFHVIPHDMNETFSSGGGGPGGFRPGRGGPPEGPPRGPGGQPAPGGPGPGGPGQGGGRRGGGMGGGPGGGGVTLDPLVGLTDNSKPLRSKLLAVPALRAKYLANVRTLAEKWLDWKTLGPVVAQYRTLIEKEVEIDTRKLDSLEAFKEGTADAPPAAAPGGAQPGGAQPGGRRVKSLRAFADERRAFLLGKPEVRNAGK